jgi:SAM-dependent methyltransferase
LTDGEGGYLLDNSQKPAGARLHALAELFDRVTFGHLSQLGVAAGWRCWEVGAGGPTVASWLATQVGPTGHVLASDIDLTWLPQDAAFDVVRHDVGVDALPEKAFDLVHARLVLVHLPDRQRALEQMVSALGPGGWLLLEEADPGLQPLLCIDEHGPEQALANRIRAGFRSLMAQHGADLAYGRTLPRQLRSVGLVDVGADGYFPITSPACAALERATVEQIRDQLVSARLATDDQVEQHLANVDAGRLDLATSPLISAWGRRTDLEH